MATNGTARFPDKQGKNRGVGYGVPPLETRFRPGRSGNPAGRPRRKTLSELIAALLDRTKLDGRALPDGMCVADLLAEAIVTEALRGKFAFAKEVWNRIDGKVPDRPAGPDGGPSRRPLDLSRLSDDELDFLGRIAAKIDGSDSPDDPPTYRGGPGEGSAVLQRASRRETTGDAR